MGNLSKEHKKLLSCWHKLEHFSPASTPKITNNNLSLLEEIEPWKKQYQIQQQDKVIEYTVYLGVFDSSIVNDFVKKFFKDKSKNQNYSSSKICFASLKLDIEGKYINDSFGVSTLPWALSQLEKNNITNNDWERSFNKTKTDLIEYLHLNLQNETIHPNNQTDEASKIFDKKMLVNLQNEIERLCGWTIKPSKQIYIERIEKNKRENCNSSKSNADILNSFYVKDLEKIISRYYNKKNSTAFLQYLDGNIGHQRKRLDVTENIEELKRNLTPKNYPDGCWPSDYTLSLMQQYAVNNIFNNLSDNNDNGMYSVNGPPGTGKTTLLRDIIAPIIVKRAKELVKIDNPSKAFRYIGPLKISDDNTPYLYAPIESIRNFGIVIASSNNGAVENISKELPLKKEVSKQYNSKISYFKSVAEQCVSEENWGIFSAVLGNKENINHVLSCLWFNCDYTDLRNTLKEDISNINSQWDSIRKEFKKKLNEIEAEKDRLEKIKKDCMEMTKVKKLLLILQNRIKETETAYKKAKKELEIQESKKLELDDRKKEIMNELTVIRNSKPNFFVYILSKKIRNAYKTALQKALSSYNEIVNHIEIESKSFKHKKNTFNHIKTEWHKENYKLKNLKSKNRVLLDKTQNAKKELQNNYADSEYWQNIESKESQESCPWYSNKLKKLQSELYIISLKMNEIFILAANAKSKRILTTLSGFFDYLRGGITASNEQIKAMWDTFFLVIPVISSTFASIHTMFKDLAEEDIPWLFIDEAGQAVPQAAAGSIWRSKRVCIVGDPFQIEPVVTISNIITDNIAKYFGLNSNQINSELSVQTMADRVNPLGTYLTMDSQKQWIGIPLRVHRRCIDPMFKISNSIAYDNTMFCSTLNPKKIKVNFQTSFIHCTGKVQGRHFVKEQAEIVKQLLIKEINYCWDLPNVFIITPFSEISSELKKYLRENLYTQINKYKQTNYGLVNSWLNSHIGTVHTFQGKQAEGVIFCLGLDDSSKGAAAWASKKPNLLNVAITRAKYRFVAIGDKSIWLKMPYFNQLSKL